MSAELLFRLAKNRGLHNVDLSDQLNVNILFLADEIIRSTGGHTLLRFF